MMHFFAKKTACLAIVTGTRFVQLFLRQDLVQSLQLLIKSILRGRYNNKRSGHLR
jgi:hypothetical protein